MRIVSALKWSFLGAFLLLVVGIAFAYSQGQFTGRPIDGPPIALRGARLYDPAADSVTDPVTVVISGREIVAVGQDATVPAGARVLSVSGLTLLPGFIDSHVHLSGIRTKVPGGSREIGWLGYFWKFVRKFPARRRALIEAGVTSVKSLGDPYPWIVNLAERIDRHELAGPRIFAAGPMFTAPGGHPVARFRRAGQGDTSFIAQVTRQVTGTAEAQAAVNQIARRVHLVTAVLETGRDRDLPRLPAPVLRAIATTAHERGLRVLAHVGSLGDLRTALLTGVDVIEHIPADQEIDSITVSQLGERNVFVDPTLTVTGWADATLLADSAPARIGRENVRRLHDAGVPIVVGSDAPNPGAFFGRTFQEELRGLVDVGLSPREAIAAATSVAAECIGLSDRLGTIAPGKWADIIAVGGDPLADITATADVYLVIADGQILVDRLDERPRPAGVVTLGVAGPDAASIAEEGAARR